MSAIPDYSPAAPTYPSHKLQRDLHAVLASRPHTQIVEPDPRVAMLAERLGVDVTGVAVEGVRAHGRTFNVLCLPYRAASTLRLGALKAAAKAESVRLLIIPESAVRRQPRLGNCTLAVRALDSELTASARMAVLCHVFESGGVSTLAECAGVITDHSDPFGGILALAVDGLVDIDFDRALTPHSLVELAI